MMSGPTFTPSTTPLTVEEALLQGLTSRPEGENAANNLSSRAPDDDGSAPNLGVSVTQFIWVYVCPVILLVGVVGNCLTIAVMRRKRLRGGTVAIYLILMAIADTCFLVVGIIPEWLEALDVVVFKKIHPVTCKLEKFVGYTSGDTAIWLLVVFTFDRFVAVCFPLRKSEVCTTKRAWILGGCCLLLGVAKNLHVFWTRGAQYVDSDDGGPPVLKSNCGRPTKEYDHFESFVRPWIAFALVSAIPFFLICAFNIGIVKTLLCMPITPASPDSGTNRTERKYSQTTLMCISVSILFLVTITPSIVIVIGRPYWDDDKENPNYMYLTAKGINNALVFMNHSLNFFLYCLTGRRFREQLLLMFKSCCRIDDGFPNSAAQKASLYLKTIHKFSQEFITSTGPRTEDTTAGTSVSTGLTTTTGLSRQSTKSANKKIKPDKSKESFKSLDSESSLSDPVVDLGVDAKSLDCVGEEGESPVRPQHPVRPPTPGASVEARLRPRQGSFKPLYNPNPTSTYTQTYTPTYTPTPTYPPMPTSPPLKDPNPHPNPNPHTPTNPHPNPDPNPSPRGVTQTQTRCSVYMDDDGADQRDLQDQEGGKVTTPQGSPQEEGQLTGSSSSTSGSSEQYGQYAMDGVRGETGETGGVGKMPVKMPGPTGEDQVQQGPEGVGAGENVNKAYPTLEEPQPDPHPNHHYNTPPSVPATEQCRHLADLSRETPRGQATSGLQIFPSGGRDSLGEGTHV